MDFKIKDFTIEKFNNDVNNSGDLDKKYFQWQEYRNKISGYISHAIKGKKLSSILVMGAGECNDIDLSFLVSNFSEITLCDIDIKSIDEGIRRQKIADDMITKITKVKADFTGLDDIGFFEELSELTSKKTSQAEISEYISDAIKSIKIDGTLPDYSNKYDAVLVLPTYTQLAYTQMETLLRILYQYNIYPIEHLNKMLTAMHYAMPKIIKNYNELILSILKSKGHLFVLSDILEITDEKVLSDISGELDNKEYIMKALEKNCSEFGMMGLDDLKARIETMNTQYEVWPFDDERKFLVEFLQGTKL
ncbi:MAG: hypothetical protein AB1Z23_09570 [Eubacteriales bacterium]